VRTLSYAVALAMVWVLLWGSASPANVLSGLAVGSVLVMVVPGLRRRGGGRFAFRPLGLLRLAGHMVVVTVTSNVELAREVLSHEQRLRTAIVGVPLPGCSDELITLISNLLALSPGSMPIDLRQGPTTVLYVHVLHLHDVERVRTDILRLTDLVVRAFGSDRTIADQDAYLRAHRP